MRKILKISLILSLSLLLFSCGEFVGFADNDDPDVGKVDKVKLHLGERDLETLYSSVSQDTYADCRVEKEGWRGDGKIKVRGYTSRMHHKKSFMLKIDGKKYVLERGQTAGGVDNRIAMRAYRLAGLPSCDTETIALFINDEYLGCYNFIYYYDEDEIDGELYKCHFKEHLDMGSDNPLASVSEKKFPDDNDMSNLEHLVSACVTKTDAEWADFVRRYVKIHEVATYLAVHNFLTVKDTASTNYYICFDDMYYFLPWDNEMCIYMDISGYELTGANQLVRRLFQVPELKAAYNSRMNELFINPGPENILAQLRSEAIEMYEEADKPVKEDPVYGSYYREFVDKKKEAADYLDSTSGRVTWGALLLP